MRPRKALAFLIFFLVKQQKMFCYKSTIFCDTANKKGIQYGHGAPKFDLGALFLILSV
jgi:hypothetical protein